MKKSLAKLTLKKESLRHLMTSSASELKRVNGGTNNDCGSGLTIAPTFCHACTQ